MEEKIKREAKQLVEKLFNKYDTLGSKALTRDDTIRVMTQLLDPEPFDEVELRRIMETFVKDAKYSVHNKQTNKFEVQFQKEALDFPAVMTIAVRMLAKTERYKNTFSDTGLVQMRHFEPPKPKLSRKISMEGIEKRKIF